MADSTARPQYQGFLCIIQITYVNIKMDFYFI